jgi:hypothetical protein
VLTCSKGVVIDGELSKHLSAASSIAFPAFVCCFLAVCVCVLVNFPLDSAQNLLSSRLLSKNLKIRIYETIILPLVLYGCETWSLTVREEHRLGWWESQREGGH